MKEVTTIKGVRLDGKPFPKVVLRLAYISRWVKDNSVKVLPPVRVIYPVPAQSRRSLERNLNIIIEALKIREAEKLKIASLFIGHDCPAP